MMEKVMVIIPVYNGATYLEECVDSVLNQPYENLSVVIVNDGSKDNSLEVAKKIASKSDRVRVLDQENQGVSSARNNGIEFALKQNVNYIAFLDSDDVWTDNYFTSEMMKRISAEDADAVRFGYLTGNETLTRGKTFPVEQRIYKNDAPLFGGSFCSYLYKSSILEQHHLRFPLGIKVHEDVVFLYVFLSMCKTVVYLSCFNFIYRSNSSSVLHTKIDCRDKYLKHVIPSWDWAKKECSSAEKTARMKKSLCGCDSMKKIYLSEYIQYACEEGIRIKTIHDTIEEFGMKTLFEDASVWMDETSAERLKNFTDKPKTLWLKYRMKGIISKVAIKFFRNRTLTQKKRYPLDLKSFYNRKS